MAKVKKDDAGLIEDEVEAIEGYDRAISTETDPERKEVLEHIRDEEKEHIEEIEDMDKGKDMTSDEAWQDFKSNYDKEDFDEAHKDDVTSGDSGGDVVATSRKVKNMKSTTKSTDAQNDSTLEGKLDTVATMINELETDVERTLDVIPQVEGEAAGEMAEGEEEEDDLFGNDDDIFGDDEGEEGAVDEEGEPVDGEGVADEEGSDEEGEPFGEESEDGEEATDDVPAEDSIDGEDSSTDDAEYDDETEEDEEIASDEDDELMEKMVKTIVRQNELIKSLTARMDALEKNQRNMTVQKQNLGKGKAIRHHPIYKSVGVVSKPPVQNGFNSRFNMADEDNTLKSFKDPKALVENYKQKGIL